MATTNMRIVIRRDEKSNWDLNQDKVLLAGEQGFETDKNRIKVGNGAKKWRELDYLAGGLTEITTGQGLLLTDNGRLTFDNEGVIGDTGGAKDVVEYVALELGDYGTSNNVIDYVDDQLALKANLGGAHFSGVITASNDENYIPFLFSSQDAFPSAEDAHGAVLHSHDDGAMFFAHGGAFHQILDVNTAYTKGEMDSQLSFKANSQEVYLKSETYSQAETDVKIAEVNIALANADVALENRIIVLEDDPTTKTYVDDQLTLKADLDSSPTFTGTINALGATFTETVVAGGFETIGAIVGNNLELTGGITAQNLVVSTSLVGNNLTVTDSVQAANITVSGAVQCQNVAADGGITCDNLQTSAGIIADTDITAGGNLDVTGDVTAAGDATVTGGVTAATVAADSATLGEVGTPFAAAAANEVVTQSYMQSVTGPIDTKVDVNITAITNLESSIEDADGNKGRFFQALFGDNTTNPPGGAPFYGDDNTAKSNGVAVGEVYLKSSTSLDDAVLAVVMS